MAMSNMASLQHPLPMTTHPGPDMQMKSVKVEEVTRHGKAVSVSAEDWLHSQKNMSSMVESHTETLASMSKTVRTLEQQVKAIARVIATSNLQMFRENMKADKDEARRFLDDSLKQLKKELMTHIEEEVNELNMKRNHLSKKVDESEEKMVNLMSERFEENLRRNQEIQTEVEKAIVRLGDAPNLVHKETSAIKELFQGKLKEIKQQVLHAENAARDVQCSLDKQILSLTSEFRAKVGSCMDKISADCKVMQNANDSHSHVMNEKVKLLKDEIAQETKNRESATKRVFKEIGEMMHESKVQLERHLASTDDDIDRKARLWTHTLAELKKTIENEKTQRESSFSDLNRRLAEEKKERDMDEEKLLGMISSCMGTLDRMHQGR